MGSSLTVTLASRVASEPTQPVPWRSMATTVLDELKKEDRTWKPGNFDDEATAILSYYEDSARALTVERLKKLGVGLANNERPLEVSLLRRIIDRVATVYDRPPTRWLLQGGLRLPDNDPSTVAMLKALELAKADQAWRLVDSTRACVRQCLIRYYPNDYGRSVDLRVFGPQDVLRQPNPGAPDRIEADRRIALKLAGKVYELWTRTLDGWICQWVDEKGEPLPEQPGPFAAVGGVSPYAELPLQMVYDSFPGGRAWLPLRLSRRAWVEAINALANDLWSLVKNQAHTTRVAKFADPNHHYPEEAGHSAVVEISPQDDVEDLTPNPAIAECQAVLESLLRMWTLSEDLPAEEFQPGRQVVTGAALRVLDRPLLSRRESQIPMAIEDEAAGYRKLRAVWNVHAETWGRAPLDETTELSVEIADLDIPVDGASQQEQLKLSLELGTMSKVDAIQRDRCVSRAKALQILAQVQADTAALAVEKPTQPANGAQADVVVTLLEKVSAGAIPRDAAVASLAELLVIDAERADAMLASAGKGPPRVPPATAPNG